MEFFSGGIDVENILSKWYKERDLKYGAMIPFIGVVRDDDGIEALSFDIYIPMFEKWFDKWRNLEDVEIKMVHSIGNVEVGETSFMCVIFTKHRKKGFEYLEKFVEDFKATAPIWKYDVKNNKRIFALKRSKQLPFAGILAK